MKSNFTDATALDVHESPDTCRCCGVKIPEGSVICNRCLQFAKAMNAKFKEDSDTVVTVHLTAKLHYYNVDKDIAMLAAANDARALCESLSANGVDVNIDNMKCM